MSTKHRLHDIPNNLEAPRLIEPGTCFLKGRKVVEDGRIVASDRNRHFDAVTVWKQIVRNENCLGILKTLYEQGETSGASAEKIPYGIDDL